MKRTDSSDYASLFLNDTPLMDVRAPVEFERGAFPNAVNLPLLNDQQRKAVGICYKNDGQESAVALGYQLVCGEALEIRRQAWIQFGQDHPHGYLYCFRGGLRSQLVQEELAANGIIYPRVAGGYKAMRNYLSEQLKIQALETDFRVIAGKTGAGKTKVIERRKNSVDLERLANHRGSSFGKNLSPQPTQINFENQLAIDLIKIAQSYIGPVAIEDEGSLIGCCALPAEIKHILKCMPVMIVSSPLERRVQNIAHDYICEALQQHQQKFGAIEGWKIFRQSVQSSLGRIQRRLGGLRYRQLATAFNSALDAYQCGRPLDVFYDWISTLLTEYYDPMYDYQLRKFSRKILFEGSVEEVLVALNNT